MIIEHPNGLDLMPDEELLAQHRNFYASNKRIINHSDGLMGTKTEDLSYKHISTIAEEVKKPLLLYLGTSGLVFLLFGLLGVGSYFIGIGLVVGLIGLYYKKIDIVITNVGNHQWRIENADSASGKQLLQVIRENAYVRQS